MVRALENPYLTCLGHPTGRLLGSRESSLVDMDRIIDAARDSGTALEINASPLRMDLDDAHIHEARDAGVMLAIGTDAHTAAELDHMKYGVILARRGWCAPEHLLNTRDAEPLLEWAR